MDGTYDNVSCWYVVCNETAISPSRMRIDSVEDIDLFGSMKELVGEFGGRFDMFGADERWKRDIETGVTRHEQW